MSELFQSPSPTPTPTPDQTVPAQTTIVTLAAAFCSDQMNNSDILTIVLIMQFVLDIWKKEEFMDSNDNAWVAIDLQASDPGCLGSHNK